MKEKGIIELSIEDSIKNSYLDYAMSVIVGRALPDVRDGLKPVHRRVLYAMSEMGIVHNKPYKKSARIVGDVIGKYHPHGDAAVYDTVVRMAQDFSMRYPLIDGQGNFGSIDGDSPAAMRYTEIRMAKIAEEMLADLDKNTVDFIDNYDGSLSEPVVLPTKIPNLLINGGSGIAVGMATNIPPHNLTEVINALQYMLKNENYTAEGVLNYIKGPDFPTAGIIMGISDIKNAYLTGRASIKVRARTHIEELKNGRERIIVTELPYQVNKANLIEKIAELVRDKKITGISDLRDESDRDGIRVVIEIKKGDHPDIILNRLYKYTSLETSFGINMVALIDGRPKTFSLLRILEEFIKHRIVVVTRRTEYLLKHAENRLHILEGLKLAVENIDEVIKIIRGSNDAKEAKSRLMDRFAFTNTQSQAILDMRLQKLTGLEIDKLEDEYKNTLKDIEFYKNILNNRDVLNNVIYDELTEIKDKYGDERLTEISSSIEEINVEDLIPDDEAVVTITHNGYIKRTPLTSFTAQKRGGKGKSGALSKGDDFIERIIVSSNHSKLMFFTNFGNIYFLKVYELPESAPGTRGRHISNFIEFSDNEYIASVLSVSDNVDDKNIIFGTKKGLVKKSHVNLFKSGRSGIKAIKLRDGDEIVSTDFVTDDDNILLATKNGKAIHFSASEIRSMGRNASGVKGIDLAKSDEVVSMEIASGAPFLLTVTENGFGKRTMVNEYRLQSRGGKGVKLSKVTPKTGNICGAKQVLDSDDVMLITKSGKIIRTGVSQISVLSRDTQGVTLMNTGDDYIVSFAVIKEV